MRIGKAGIVSLQQPQRRIVLVRVLAEDDDRGVVLGREEHFVAPIVDGDAERPVRRLERAHRRRIAGAAVLEDHQRVDGVVVRREDVA